MSTLPNNNNGNNISLFQETHDAQDSAKVLKAAIKRKQSKRPHPIFEALGEIYPYITVIFFVILGIGSYLDYPQAKLFTTLHYKRNSYYSNYDKDGVMFDIPDFEQQYYFQSVSQLQPTWNWYHRGVKDWYTGITTISGLLLYHWLLKNFILKPIAIKFGLLGEKVEKFCQAGYFAIYYPTLFIFGYYAIRDSPWFFTGDLGGETSYPTTIYTGPLKVYYLLQNFNWYAQVLVLLMEERRSDFHLFFFHHIITIILCSLSWHSGWVGFGTMIMWNFDAADIFLYLGKCVLYIGEAKNSSGPIYKQQRLLMKEKMGDSYSEKYNPHPFYLTLADTLLYIFGAVWILTRHVHFCYLIYQAWYQVRSNSCFGHNDPITGCQMPAIWHTLFMFCLVGLEFACFAWLREIIRVATAKEATHDHRSD